ncbi:MAG: beta-propeller fold lactonase family protein [Planctomycetota bacterium]|nr:beta-propeller fold lactonase family protein [Planctomycetota bacterium]
MFRFYVNTLVVCVVISSTLGANPFLLVSLPDEQQIAVYQMDLDTGALQHVRNDRLPADPGPMSLSHDGKTLYLSLRNAGKLASFTIHPETAELSHLTTVDADQDPAYHWQDYTSRYLLSAYYHTGRVSVHSLGDRGEILAESTRWIETELKAHCIMATPDNRHVFVPHTGPNKIFQFTFDANRGTLDLKEDGVLLSEDQTGPRHIDIHPRKPWAYVDYEQGNQVAFYRIRAGKLIRKQVISSVPDDWPRGEGATARLTLSPDARFVYAANRGHNSIAGFKIHPLSGKMTHIGTFPTAANPRSFVITACGKWLYAGGQDTNQIALFRRDVSNGSLQRIDTIETGRKPWWLQIVNQP